ncbi:MAG: TerD family protein [Lachnospiraceae bacterium]|nr:TerD family protein [Lachnospiraceae bacterium]
MSIKLKKGEEVSVVGLGAQLPKVVVALGWDEATADIIEAGLFGRKKKVPIDIDCDASALALVGGKLFRDEDIISYTNLNHSSGAINHLGDNLTGEGDGDNEQIVVDINNLPYDYDEIVFVANIYRGKAKQQHFGMIKNAFIRILDSSNKEICKFDLTDDYSGSTSLFFGKLYRKDGEWKFVAMGEGTMDDDIEEIAQKYK